MNPPLDGFFRELPAGRSLTLVPKARWASGGMPFHALPQASAAAPNSTAYLLSNPFPNIRRSNLV
ncbi:MAG: hypothetical protein ABI847_12910 [Anaerolineales bacterium]